MEFSSLDEAFREPTRGFYEYNYDPVVIPREVEVLHPDQQEIINKQNIQQQIQGQTPQQMKINVPVEKNDVPCPHCGRKNNNTILIVIIIFLIIMLMRK